MATAPFTLHLKRVILLAAVVAALAAGTLASNARADGDPASDYLLEQKVFFPFDEFPAQQQAQFAGLVEAANRAGFKVRVALITSSYDMGSVTSLYRKPHTYARFLGEELSFIYKQRLLVVMPNGFGFNWPKHPTKPAYVILQGIAIKPGSTGMLSAAQAAVQRLAAADGVKIKAPTPIATPTQRNSHDRLIIIAAAVAALLLAAAGRLALR